ncbi:MAG: 4-hydroxy-tetrahydrodipicolinate synthase [Planctomycetes bacterium]|nr:4-hydroxy-tetrahydrodipicolinate synthase [Planctomycetota bacterium]
MARGNNPFVGSIVALPTPFRGGSIDESALAQDIDFHIENGTQGLVVGGSTGEAASLSMEERHVLWSRAIGHVDGRVPVLLGIGAPSTSATLDLARAAVAEGADGLLAVTPYYTVPDARGLIAHYSALAEAHPNTPILLYNVPNRTGCDLQPSTVHELADRYENIVGIKECTRSIPRIQALMGNPNLAVYAGDDLALFDFMRHGAQGAITVTGNLLPAETAELIGLASINPNNKRVETLEKLLAPVIAALSLGPNPTPIKAALEMARGYPAELRLPLLSAEPALRDRIRAAIASHVSLQTA